MATILCFRCPGIWARPSEQFFAGLSGVTRVRGCHLVKGLGWAVHRHHSHACRFFLAVTWPSLSTWSILLGRLTQTSTARAAMVQAGAKPLGAKAQHPQCHLCCIQCVKTSHETRVPGWRTGLHLLRGELLSYRGSVYPPWQGSLCHLGQLSVWESYLHILYPWPIAVDFQNLWWGIQKKPGFLLNFISWSSFRFTAKWSEHCREHSSAPWPHKPTISSPLIPRTGWHLCHHQWTPLTRHYRPEFILDTRFPLGDVPPIGFDK